MTGLGIIRDHLALSLSLFLRFGAVLTALWAAGALGGQILLRLAVEIGLHSRLLGLFALAPVILLQLVVFVGMFVILRRGNAASSSALRAAAVAPAAHPPPDRMPPVAPPPAADDPRPGALAGVLLAALVPFYGYYAGWGFLGDTLRSYAQMFYRAQMARIDFDNPAPATTALEVGQTGWVVLAVAAIWIVRRAAKAIHARTGAGLWPLVVVACEASWALLGLYVLSSWKNVLIGWLASLPAPGEMLGWVTGPAVAAVASAAVPSAAVTSAAITSAAITSAVAIPVDWPQPVALWPWLVGLFWYAMLPLVWFNLGAIVSGHDLQRIDSRTQRVTGRALDRWHSLPRPVTDFIGHFWEGLVKRWHAVANGVMLAASAGVALTVSVLVLWRLVAWLGSWAWIGAAALIGPQDMLTWQVLTVPLSLLFGTPGGPPGGLLVSPLQFCIIAAGLDLARRAAGVTVGVGAGVVAGAQTVQAAPGRSAGASGGDI